MAVPAAFLAALLAPGGPALGQGAGGKYSPLLERLPDHANALLLVDVDGLFNSPMGKRENWR